MKINLISIKGVMRPKCTNCGHVFDTDAAQTLIMKPAVLPLGNIPFALSAGTRTRAARLRE